MNTLSVDVCYRPLRIGWAMRGGDLEGFRKIVRLNATLCGGQFNPIIVVDQKEHAEQLVDMFRVDLILGIDDSDEVKDFIDRFPYLISPFMSKSLIINERNDRPFSNALDIENTLTYLRNKPEWREFKKIGFRAFHWQLDDSLADCLLAQFGGYPPVDEVGIDYREIAKRATDATDYSIDPTQPLPEDLFEQPGINYLSKYLLTPHYSIRAGRESPGFFVGNASSLDDLVCFWNLRAVNIPLLFIDLKFASRYEKLVPVWIDITKRATSQGGRENFPEFAVWSLNEINEDIRAYFGDHRILNANVTEHSWNGHNLVSPMMHFAGHSTLGVSGDEFGKPGISFQLSEKPFSDDNHFHTQHLIASISFLGGFYQDDQHTLQPPYLPELNEFYARNMGLSYDDFRIEYERLGLVISATSHDKRISALPVADLMKKVFEMAGFKSAPSSAGLLTKQLISRLGGLQGGRPFKIPGVRRLLKTFGLAKSFTKRSALQLIASRDPDNPGVTFSDHKGLFIGPRDPGTELEPKDVFVRLVEKGMFRIGIDLMCPSCRMASWTAVDELKHQLACDLCGEVFDATSQLVNSEWRYRRSGVLGREKNAQGAIPVVLTLQQLDANLSSIINKAVYSTSLELNPKNGGTLPKCEVDFIWLVPNRHGKRTEIILGECKDIGPIDEDEFESDVRHLQQVANALPSKRFRTYALISKLAPFTPKEIEIANSTNGKYEHSVILLTDRELEPYHMYERTKKEFDIDGYAFSSDRLARNTAKLYFSDQDT